MSDRGTPTLRRAIRRFKNPRPGSFFLRSDEGGLWVGKRWYVNAPRIIKPGRGSWRAHV